MSLKGGPDFEKEGTAGFSSSVVNLVKSIVGAGMLSLPFAMANVGVIPGLMLLSVAALLSVAGLQLLILASDRLVSLGLQAPRASNFAALAKPTYPGAAHFFDFAVALKCLIVSASYLTVACDVLPAVVSGIFKTPMGILDSRLFWVTMITSMIAPVTFMHKMDSLKYTSFLGLIGIAYLFTLSIVMFFGYNDTITTSVENIQLFVPFTFKSLGNFSVFVFAFTCHQNIFPISNEIKTNRPEQMLRLITLCLSLSFAIYVIFAVTFYGVFGQTVKGNVIENFPTSGMAFITARILYAFLMLFSYPLQTFPTRASITKLIGRLAEGSPQKKLLVHVAITSGILVSTWAIAASNVPLVLLLKVVGCTAGTVICYFLPAIFWLKLDGEVPLNKSKIAAYALLVFGVLATVIPLAALAIPG